MSSEEVAELAKAINSHADVLYESWTKGASRPDVMRRMEDTLELLADPGLTPKLEHLVSNFVKRDKEKRQQHGGASKAGDSGTNTPIGRTRSPSPQLEHGNAIPTASKKPLPKSILAVVQRFEPASPDSIPSVPARAPSPNFTNLPGIGPVSKNLLRAEASLRQNISEQNYGFQQHARESTVVDTPFGRRSGSPRRFSPTPLPVTNSYTHHISAPVANPDGHPRERHIPIERVEEDRQVSKVLLRNASSPPSLGGQGNVPNMNLTITHVSVNTPETARNKTQGIQELEREEERLVRALRTGQVIPSEKYINNSGAVEFRQKAVFEHPERNTQNSNHSRVAFAKERIRHSQEHPLTQQRLELQKRLPAPSSNLAAAVAVQQGKAKFQTYGEAHFQNGSSSGYPDHPPPPYQEKENTSNGGVGRQTWVNTMLRFGSGSSVADRVQQFEKYPSHMVGSSSPHAISSPHIESHHVSHPHPFNQHLNLNASSSTTHSPREITHTIGKPNTHQNQTPILTERAFNNNLDRHAHHPIKSEHFALSESEPYSTPVPWRTQNHVQSQKPDVLSSSKYKPRTPNASSPRTPSHEVRNEAVPRFYWPEGKPPPTPYLHDSISKAEAEFNKLANPLAYEDFGKFLQALGISLYWKRPFWTALGMKANDRLTFIDFKSFYGPLISQCPDEASRFMRVLTTSSKVLALENKNNNNANISAGMHAKLILNKDLVKELVMADFVPMIQDIIETHPGLGFLREAPEFHSRYMTTVISRIYYKVNRSWTGRITLYELRRSNLLRVIKRLEEETDVNAITEYFSYEHFYVIYCKFWELDKDHDLLIDKRDLAAHNETALSSRIIDRLFSGTVIRGWDLTSPVRLPGKMTYSDFVWFLISEEDKKSPTAIEYWFRCLDLDGDGILSPFELQHFYSEQETRIECLGIEPLDFSNVYCQMVDMLRCSPKGVRLKDLKKNPQLAAHFFNTLFNLDKYLDHEQRDPFAAAGYTSATSESAGEGESDWDKYAASEYELLIAEENPSDHLHDVSDFEDAMGVMP